MSALFRVCIARLYGGGPPLHLSPSLLSTPTQPLTPGFPAVPKKTDPPPGHHPATPRFLLSLLATAIFLSIHPIASQALNAIISSIGPHTVIDYLNFALGKAIRSPDDEGLVAAVGLENIAQDGGNDAPADIVETVKEEVADATEPCQSPLDFNIKKVDPSSASSHSDCYSLCSRDGADELAHEPLFTYGAVSNKVGEAVACWLARWGPDIFQLEEKKKDIGLPATQLASPSPPKHTVPVIWARGGLNAEWVSALVSSDALFVKGELERYEFAKSVVELRRRDGLDENEEEKWTKMFSQGIYYANMVGSISLSRPCILMFSPRVQLAEDLIAISQDISRTSGRPYVPLAVLQEAHWSQAVLRYQITARSSSTGVAPSQRGKELGLAVTTADILTRLSAINHDNPDREREENRPYFRVPTDSSSRLGEYGGVEATSMEQLFELSDTKATGSNASSLGNCEANFFGLLSERQTASSCISADVAAKSRWSPHPPLRFAVEFWDVHCLKEKSPLHSHTVWYAGNFYNVYVQMVRKKGKQLGVYLHRQSSVDPIPLASAPTVSTTRTGRPPNSLRQAPAPAPAVSTSPSSTSPVRAPSRSATPLSTISHPGSPTLVSSTIPATAPCVTPPHPYRDPRSSISAYFTISCASATGSALTRFTSAPDVFSVSQSWGWKSSSLMAEEFMEEGEGRVTDIGLPVGPEVSLRATVVLGIV